MEASRYSENVSVKQQIYVLPILDDYLENIAG
jgi:hypothetical protein